MGVKFGFKLNNSMVVGPDGGGGDVPSELKNEMNEVFNRKFGTSQIYDPDTWADTVNIMTPLPTKTATGSVATFTDGADGLPMKSVVCEINAVQSGTGDPSPSNVRPISGFTGLNLTRAGKNLFSGVAITGYYLIDDGSEVREPQNAWNISNYIQVVPTATYYINTDGTTGGRAKHCFYDENQNFLSYIDSGSQAFTVPSNAKYVRFSLRASAVNIQLEVGSSATSYEPYTATVIPITWQTDAGTVYGGSLDVTSGVLTVTHTKDDLSNLTWRVRATGSVNVVLSAELTNSYTASGSSNCDWKCDRHKYIGRSAASTLIANVDTAEVGVYSYSYNGNTANIYFVTDDLTATAGDGNLVYELATPQTYQLTPQQVNSLLGVNNIWHDANGDTTVTYYVDINAIMSQLEA